MYSRTSVSLALLVVAHFGRGCSAEAVFSRRLRTNIFARLEQNRGETQSAAIKSIFVSLGMGSIESRHLHNWFQDGFDDPDPNYCWFSGVTCDPYRNVIFLDLNSTNLSGTIPPAIAAFSHLRRLRLLRNNIGGTLPSELGQLSELISINVGRNHISGTIPPEISSASSLRLLALQGNHIGGTIPHSLCEMSDMKFLSLSYNDIGGTIPTCIGDLPQVRLVRIRNLDLTGTLPPKLCNQSHLNASVVENPFGCDGIACPSGTFHPTIGRQQSVDAPCLPCDIRSNVIGNTECRFVEVGPLAPTPTPTMAPEESMVFPSEKLFPGIPTQHPSEGPIMPMPPSQPSMVTGEATNNPSLSTQNPSAPYYSYLYTSSPNQSTNFYEEDFIEGSHTEDLIATAVLSVGVGALCVTIAVGVSLYLTIWAETDDISEATVLGCDGGSQRLGIGPMLEGDAEAAYLQDPDYFQESMAPRESVVNMPREQAFTLDNGYFAGRSGASISSADEPPLSHEWLMAFVQDPENYEVSTALARERENRSPSPCRRGSGNSVKPSRVRASPMTCKLSSPTSSSSASSSTKSSWLYSFSSSPSSSSSSASSSPCAKSTGTSMSNTTSSSMLTTSSSDSQSSSSTPSGDSSSGSSSRSSSGTSSTPSSASSSTSSSTSFVSSSSSSTSSFEYATSSGSSWTSRGSTSSFSSSSSSPTCDSFGLPSTQTDRFPTSRLYRSPPKGLCRLVLDSPEPGMTRPKLFKKALDAPKTKSPHVSLDTFFAATGPSHERNNSISSLVVTNDGCFLHDGSCTDEENVDYAEHGLGVYGSLERRDWGPKSLSDVSLTPNSKTAILAQHGSSDDNSEAKSMNDSLDTDLVPPRKPKVRFARWSLMQQLN